MAVYTNPNRSSARAAETPNTNPNLSELSTTDGVFAERPRVGEPCVRLTRKAQTVSHDAQGAPAGGAILLKRDEVCRLLGNISPRTVARMEERGLIRPVRILRHKLYSRAALEALVNNETNWAA
jgi:hypothetical protein